LWEKGASSEVPDCNGGVAPPPLIQPLELASDIGGWWEPPLSVIVMESSSDDLCGHSPTSLPLLSPYQFLLYPFREITGGMQACASCTLERLLRLAAANREVTRP